MTLQDIGAAAGLATIVGSLLLWMLKHFVIDTMKKSLEQRIDDRTYPIQANANGGSSLPDAIKLLHEFKRDVNDRFDKIEDRQLVIGDTTKASQALLANHLEWHNLRA